MRKLLLLIILLGSFVTYSQETLTEKEKAKRQRNLDAVNPFHKFGYKAKVATLSKGKYLEMFITDSIVQIASFHYNILTNKVTGFTQLDTLNSEATLRPDVVSRWINPDPLSDEFPDKSPYAFTNNNPIYFTDPTGLAPQGWDNDYGIDKNGNVTLIKETDDKFDRLYVAKSDADGNAVVDKNGNAQKAKSGEGTENTDYVKVDKATKESSTIISDLSQSHDFSDYNGFRMDIMRNIDHSNVSYATTSNGVDASKVFQFASDNSNVEWGMSKFNSGNIVINTSHQNDYTLNPSKLGLGSNFSVRNLDVSVHSHPNNYYASRNDMSLASKNKSALYFIYAKKGGYLTRYNQRTRAIGNKRGKPRKLPATIFTK